MSPPRSQTRSSQPPRPEGMLQRDTLTLWPSPFFGTVPSFGARGMGKRSGNTNAGELVKGKTVRTASDDAGGKFVSEKAMSTV